MALRPRRRIRHFYVLHLLVFYSYQMYRMNVIYILIFTLTILLSCAFTGEHVTTTRDAQYFLNLKRHNIIFVGQNCDSLTLARLKIRFQSYQCLLNALLLLRSVLSDQNFVIVTYLGKLPIVNGSSMLNKCF